jgi:hypothetical protein
MRVLVNFIMCEIVTSTEFTTVTNCKLLHKSYYQSKPRLQSLHTRDNSSYSSLITSERYSDSIPESDDEHHTNLVSKW